MDVTQSRKELQRSESIKNEMCQVSFSTQLSSCLPLCSYGIQCHLLLGFEEHFPRKGLAHQGLTLSDRAPKSPPSIKPGCKIQNNLNLFCPTEFETWPPKTRQSKQCGFSIYIFDNSKSKSMVRLVRAEKMVLSGLVFARKIARMILNQNI